MQNKLETKQISLDELIAGYLKAKSDFLSFKKDVQPTPPPQSKAHTAETWNAYITAKNKYDKDYREWDDRKKETESELSDWQQKVFDTLPARHIWFVTDNKKYAIAIQASDWPMSTPDILIKESPVIEDLPQLRLQIIN